MTYTARPLDAETWPAFAELVERNNGVFGGCWCMGFHADGFAGSAEANREAKHAHVRAGTVHQVLVLDGEECVGWCQYGRPAELPNIKNPKAYDKEATEPPDWRIGCIFTGSGRRRTGVARAAVTAVLGTHTHVPTADAQILPKGTAFICDVGMTGPYASVLGREIEPVVARFLDGMPRRFGVASGDVRLSGALIEISASMARAEKIELLTVRK